MTKTMGCRACDLPWNGIVVLVTAVGLLAAYGCADGTGPRTGPPEQFLVVSGDSQRGEVGLELPRPLVVWVIDSTGLPVRGHTVEFRVVAGDGSLAENSVITDAHGLARNHWTLGTTATTVLDSHRVEVRSATHGSAQPIVVAAFGATAVAGPAATLLRYEGDGGSCRPTETLSPSVRVVDRFDNPVADARVAWSVSPGHGTVLPAETTSESYGIARTTWTSPSLVGTYTITASAPGLIGSPQSFALGVVPGPVKTLVIVAGDGQTAVAGTAVPVKPAVQAFDRYGNIAQASVTFQVMSGGGSITGGVSYTDWQMGIAVVGSWTLGAQPGKNELSAFVEGRSGSVNSPWFTATGTEPPVRNRQEVYDLVATFTRVYAGSHQSDADATLVGELALVDTVTYQDGDIAYRFPITFTGKFCYHGTSDCRTPELWPGRYSLLPDGSIDISLYRETLFTIPVLRFRGPLGDRTISGSAEYNYTNYFADWYYGTFLATRK